MNTRSIPLELAVNRLKCAKVALGVEEKGERAARVALAVERLSGEWLLWGREDFDISY